MLPNHHLTSNSFSSHTEAMSQGEASALVIYSCHSHIRAPTGTANLDLVVLW